MPLVADVRVPPGRLDQPVPEVGAQHRQLDRQRLGQPQRDRVASCVGTSASVYASRPAGADEHVLDAPAQPLLAREPAEHRASAPAASPAPPPAGSGRPPRRDRPSRVTSRARQRRHHHTSAVAASNPSRSSVSRCSSAGTSSPMQRVDALRPEARRPAAPAASPFTSVVPVQRAPASSTSSCVA